MSPAELYLTSIIFVAGNLQWQKVRNYASCQPTIRRETHAAAGPKALTNNRQAA